MLEKKCLISNNPMTEKKKYLYIIAGANGSGKSTLASELLPEEKLEFLAAALV